ncbi:MAG TPA: right-handed parallel beta-helix repeat-containing protein [Solirubrobacterales bacterium]
MKAFVSVLLAVACLLALPSAAMAVTYTVNSTGDTADNGAPNGVCETATLGECTLRAAITESNASTLVVDEIHFDAAFNGQLADTITLGSLLPPITNPVDINAGLCPTQAGQSGPCAGVEASALSYGLSVEDTNTVAISGLAITSATTGIRVVNSSKSFVARNNWLGLKLDGKDGSGSNTGIWLDPDSNEATIGGVAAGQGNVFANNSFEGLDIEGADSAKVFGNYFGVKADGVTKAANGKNIEITDTDAFEATNNEVGTTISGAAAPCDGGCNVISGGITGIDLNGEPAGNEEPATGPTTIHGNYVGLNAAGTGAVANSTFDVLVGKAENALVGGVANGDANFIAGGEFGIYAENGEGFEAEGNIIGSGPSGADLAAPGTGVFVLNLSNTSQVAVNDNVIEMDGGVGVEVRFGGTEIDANFIEGAELGIWTKVGPGPAGANQIEDNVIGESEVNGIRIEDNENEVFGNSIYQSGAAGIRIQNPAALVNATENQIGGDTADSENNIRESGTDAIEIDNAGGEGASQNGIARNRGEENGGLFIDLIGSLTNGGIQPPAFGTTIQSSAAGTALPGALIRVFRKETAEPGEIESFLGEAVADGSGNWKVTYPGQIPVGTIVAATQTSEAGGTSELATATTAADPDSGKKDDGKGKDDTAGKGKGKAKAKDTTPPQTRIRKGPKRKSESTTAKFKFTSSEKGSSFQCKLDKRPWRRCKSPKTYKGLKPGKHVFRARAIDKAGNVDPTPAKRKFEVLAP